MICGAAVKGDSRRQERPPMTATTAPIAETANHPAPVTPVAATSMIPTVAADALTAVPPMVNTCDWTLRT